MLKVMNLANAGVKYDVSIARTAPNAFRVSLGTVSVDAVVRKLNDGGMQMQVHVFAFCPLDGNGFTQSASLTAADLI